uniref:Uncharacterized protein n=1 Tax=Steinernema glaseri TaxID=37863 RepID=A0A1I7YD60_9BILA
MSQKHDVSVQIVMLNYANWMTSGRDLIGHSSLRNNRIDLRKKEHPTRKCVLSLQEAIICGVSMIVPRDKVIPKVMGLVVLLRVHARDKDWLWFSGFLVEETRGIAHGPYVC